MLFFISPSWASFIAQDNVLLYGGLIVCAILFSVVFGLLVRFLRKRYARKVDSGWQSFPIMHSFYSENNRFELSEKVNVGAFNLTDENNIPINLSGCNAFIVNGTDFAHIGIDDRTLVITSKIKNTEELGQNLTLGIFRRPVNAGEAIYELRPVWYCGQLNDGLIDIANIIAGSEAFQALAHNGNRCGNDWILANLLGVQYEKYKIEIEAAGPWAAICEDAVLTSCYDLEEETVRFQLYPSSQFVGNVVNCYEIPQQFWAE